MNVDEDGDEGDEDEPSGNSQQISRRREAKQSRLEDDIDTMGWSLIHPCRTTTVPSFMISMFLIYHPCVP